MTEPLKLPIRVLVKGASTVNWVTSRGGPRSELAFARVMEQQLFSDGHPCEIMVRSMAGEPASHLSATWQREVLNFQPDVVVLIYGHYESIHLLLPRWLERHANSLRGRPGPIREFYRKRILRRVWFTLVNLQAAVDRRVNPTFRRRRPVKVAAHIRNYLDHVRAAGSPLVYIFEVPQINESRQGWFPGMSARVDVMNQVLRQVVDDFKSDDVRFFRVSEIVERDYDGDLEVAVPDGFHFSPDMHASVGRAIGADVGRWADTQSHFEPLKET